MREIFLPRTNHTVVRVLERGRVRSDQPPGAVVVVGHQYHEMTGADVGKKIISSFNIIDFSYNFMLSLRNDVERVVNIGDRVQAGAQNQTLRVKRHPHLAQQGAIIFLLNF